ncbi:NUDIX domain-containing protein [Streptomyces sp. NPDC012623]|uniref:NUDIX domain-containing protein n=1 Tax=unclassified Streptomyces TaxID=2593676 RepID=UPI0036B022FC
MRGSPPDRPLVPPAVAGRGSRCGALLPGARSILIVHPARPGAPWALPGGLVEAGESPVEALRREVHEELGIEVDVQAADLFAVEWVQATRRGRRDRLAFVFAGPCLSETETDRITLQFNELDRWAWARPEDALDLLHPRIAARIRGPLQLPGQTLYLETHNERITTP